MTTFLSPPSPNTKNQMVNLALVRSITRYTSSNIIFSFIDGSEDIVWKYENEDESESAYNEIMKIISINPSQP